MCELWPRNTVTFAQIFNLLLTVCRQETLSVIKFLGLGIQFSKFVYETATCGKVNDPDTDLFITCENKIKSF